MWPFPDLSTDRGAAATQALLAENRIESLLEMRSLRAFLLFAFSVPLVDLLARWTEIAIALAERPRNRLRQFLRQRLWGKALGKASAACLSPNASLEKKCPLIMRDAIMHQITPIVSV